MGESPPNLLPDCAESAADSGETKKQFVALSRLCSIKKREEWKRFL